MYFNGCFKTSRNSVCLYNCSMAATLNTPVYNCLVFYFNKLNHIKSNEIELSSLYLNTPEAKCDLRNKTRTSILPHVCT